MAQKNVEFPVRKVILMTEEMAARISEIRHINRIASENETIRQMLEFGLAAAERKAAAKAKPE